jgi:hypothetical protein
MTRPVAIVAGYAVRYPVAGMTSVFLNYLLGLRDLGFEPVFVEASLVPEDCYDVEHGVMTADASYGAAYLEKTFADAGLGGTRWWFANETGDHGMTRDEAIATLEGSAVLLNVGCSTWHPDFERAPRRVLVDCDPPITQIRLEARDPYLSGIVDAHDLLFTYAVNLADDWGLWRGLEQGSDGWTSITSWGQSPTVSWSGDDYGNKAVSYEAVIDLPSMVGARFELAVAADAPRKRLEAAGWHVLDPIAATRTWADFRTFIARSTGELSVAKHAFVRAQTGAVNDRSLAYLAAGKPVVCSDTGLDWIGAHGGLMPFRTCTQAAAAIEAVEIDLRVHHQAALDLAERFSADRVLADLLQRAGVRVPGPLWV